MFTGIVESTGTVWRKRRRAGIVRFEIEAPAIAKKLRRGDSVAVDGVCLTALDTGRKRFSTEAMPETLDRTTLSRVIKGSEVNLELSARVTDRIGGHIVQGHVDGVARVVSCREDEGSRRMWLQAPDDIMRYLVPKGSVTLNGVALTVVETDRNDFQVALIPHTLAATTLKGNADGDELNVEVDVLAKYVERLMER